MKRQRWNERWLGMLLGAPAWLPLVLITALGAALRAWNLADHPLWSDEFATLVFSLGHGFAGIPLDQMVSGDRLLESLMVQGLGPGATLDRLLTESNHPPLYFVLSNLWIHWWQSSGELVDLGVARSLSALFGVLAIPALYGVVRDGMGRSIALAAAFLMAVSPFALYLSQEPRHYTLGVCWAITSLACWSRVIRHWSSPDRPTAPLPPWLPWVWIGVNSLGMATHFFMGLLLVAQAITLGILTVRWGLPSVQDRWTVAIAALGTTATTLAWVPYAQSIPKAGLTDWLSETVTWITGIETIARLGAWTITMGVLLPVENQSTEVLMASGYFMAMATGLMGWGVCLAWRSRQRWLNGRSQGMLMAMGVLWGTLLAVMLAVVLLLGKDISVAARYQFVALPMVLTGMAVGWMGLWRRWPRIAIIWLLVAFLSSGFVAHGLTFQRPDRPDLMVTFMDQVNRDRPDAASRAIATVYKNHEQTGELLGLTWEWRSRDSPPPQFILLKKAPDHPAPNDTLKQAIASLPKPLDLWLVNFAAPEDLRETGQCQPVPNTKHRKPGYSAKLYHCR